MARSHDLLSETTLCASNTAKRDLIIAERNAMLEDRDAGIARLAADVAAMQKVIVQLMAQRRGGVRVQEGQGLLFSSSETDGAAVHAPSSEAGASGDADAGDQDSGDDDESDCRTKKQRAKGTKRTPGKLDTTGLPRKRELHDLPEDQRIDPASGKALVPVGELVT